VRGVSGKGVKVAGEKKNQTAKRKKKTRDPETVTHRPPGSGRGQLPNEGGGNVGEKRWGFGVLKSVYRDWEKGGISHIGSTTFSVTSSRKKKGGTQEGVIDQRGVFFFGSQQT